MTVPYPDLEDFRVRANFEALDKPEFRVHQPVFESGTTGDVVVRIYPHRLELVGLMESDEINGKLCDLPVKPDAPCEVPVKDAVTGDIAWLFLTTDGELYMQGGGGSGHPYNLSVSMPFRSK